MAGRVGCFVSTANGFIGWIVPRRAFPSRKSDSIRRVGLWISTWGRDMGIDGERFKDMTPVTGGHIWVGMAQFDKQNRLYLGTSSSGVACYDGQRVTHFGVEELGDNQAWLGLMTRMIRFGSAPLTPDWFIMMASSSRASPLGSAICLPIPSESCAVIRADSCW